MKKRDRFIAFDLNISPEVMYHLDKWYYDRWGYYVLESINRFIYKTPVTEDYYEEEYEGTDDYNDLIDMDMFE